MPSADSNKGIIDLTVITYKDYEATPKVMADAQTIFNVVTVCDYTN
jgi:hypothetical protein